MAPPLIQLKDIALTFGGTPLLSGVELSVSSAERVCLIGRNGSGKSTLLKIAAGLVEPDHGSRFVQPRATIPYLPPGAAGGRAATGARYLLAGRATNPSRPPPHRRPGPRPRQPPQLACHHQPRPPLPVEPVALHRLARSRPDQADRPRLWRV